MYFIESITDKIENAGKDCHQITTLPFLAFCFQLIFEVKLQIEIAIDRKLKQFFKTNFEADGALLVLKIYQVVSLGKTFLF